MSPSASLRIEFRGRAVELEGPASALAEAARVTAGFHPRAGGAPSQTLPVTTRLTVVPVEGGWEVEEATEGRGASRSGRMPGPNRLLAELEWRVARSLIPTESGTLAMHAAGVRLNGKGVLIVGDSGAGKSTLAWTALREGAALLGDDTVLVGRDGRLLPFPRTPKVPRAALSASGVDHDDPAILGGDAEEAWVDVSRFGEGFAPAEGSPLGGIVRPRWVTGAPVTVRPLTAEERIRALLRAIHGSGRPTGAVELILERLSTVPAVAVVFGDAAAAIEALRRE